MAHVVNLSYTRKTAPVRVDVVQYTTAPDIVFIIEDYTPTGRADIYIEKPSGEEIYNSCTIDGNEITFTPTTQCFAEVGENKAQLQILNGDKLAVSFPIKFIVVENIIDSSAAESQSEFTELQEAIGTIGQYDARIQGVIDDMAALEENIDNDFAILESAAFKWRRVLTSSDNLNDIKQMGLYAYTTSSVPQNAYYQNAAIVEVMAASSSSSTIIQRVTRFGTVGYSAYRVLYNSNWSEWSALEVSLAIGPSGKIEPDKAFGVINVEDITARRLYVVEDILLNGKLRGGDIKSNSLEAGSLNLLGTATAINLNVNQKINAWGGSFGIGDIKTGTSWDDTSVPSDTTSFTNVGEITLPHDSGRWLVFGIAQFATNSSGFRRVNISSSAGGAHDGLLGLASAPAISGVATDVRAQWFYPGDGRTVYLNARQNSGSSLSVAGRLYALKVQ